MREPLVVGRRLKTNGERPTTNDEQPMINDRPITFGTDGWRGLIAEDFTFDNVRRVAGGIAAYVLRHENPADSVFVGYDTRFISQHAARVVAEIARGCVSTAWCLGLAFAAIAVVLYRWILRIATARST